jgi:hypothetical protein
LITRRLIVGLACTCALGSRGSAEPAETKPPTVELAIVGGRERADLVEERVSSWFRAEHGALTAARLQALDPAAVLAARGPAGVRIWVVLADPTLAQVFFAVRERDGAAPRFLVTDVALPSGLDELGIEQLALVVYPSALALWAGNVESARAHVEQELRHRPGDALAASFPVFLLPGPQRDETRAPSRLAIGAEYGVVNTGAGVAHRIGALASIGGRDPSVRVGARLHVAALVPRDVVAAGVELELVGATAALGVTVIAPRRAFDLVAELGAGLELVRYRTGALADPSLMPTDGLTIDHIFSRSAPSSRVSKRS